MHTGPQLAPLAADGVDIANGGWGQRGSVFRWDRAHQDCMRSWREIAEQTGVDAR